MKMVGHQNKFIDLQSGAITIAEQSLKKETGGSFRTKDRSSLPGYGRDEGGAISEGVHSTAAKAAPFLKLSVAGLKALRFHGIARSIFRHSPVRRCDGGHKLRYGFPEWGVLHV